MDQIRSMKIKEFTEFNTGNILKNMNLITSLIEDRQIIKELNKMLETPALLHLFVLIVKISKPDLF